MTLKHHIKETFKLAIPVSIGQLGHILMGVVDSLMVGNLGSVYLAAASLVNGLFFLILVLGIGMSMAVTPLVSMAIGAKKEEECGIFLRQGLLVNIVLAIILSLFIILGADLINFMGQPPEITAAAISYFRILGLSVVPFIIFQIYRQFLEGLSDVYPPMIIAIAANIFNALFNYTLIFGHFGFQKLGLDGAGYATTTTRILMAISITIIVLSRKKYKKFEPSLKFRSINWPVIKKIIGIGLPSGLQYFFEVGAFAFSAIMIGWLGYVELASHQIAINLASVTYMIILGISSAGTIRVSHAYGKRNLNETKLAGYTALGIATSIMIFFGSSFIIFRNILPKFYIDEPAVLELSSSLLIIAAAFQIFDGLQATGLGVLRGLADVKKPLKYLMGSYWLIGIPIGAALGFYFNLKTIGIWIGLSVGLAILAISLLYRFQTKLKELKKEFH